MKGAYQAALGVAILMVGIIAGQMDYGIITLASVVVGLPILFFAALAGDE